MKEQQYQSTTNNISNGRIKLTQPPTVPQEYYGTITNRLSPGIQYYYQSCVKEQKKTFSFRQFIY
jgi:hypothetical protein